MANIRPYCLTIGGFDPSAGAGVLADIKTFEQMKVQGLAVNTANTIQNDVEFLKVDWLAQRLIHKQLIILNKRFPIEVAKIGLVQSIESLVWIINILKEHNPSIKIIWDPILSASAGFQFHTKINEAKIKNALNNLFLVTPNVPEYEILFSGNTHQPATYVYLKGGHCDGEVIRDQLLKENNLLFELHSKRINKTEKHGTGCILSSAIAAQLSLGAPLKEACELARKYVLSVISSNNTKLGYHSK